MISWQNPGLGCKGSLVQIQSRRPFKTNTVAAFQFMGDCSSSQYFPTSFYKFPTSFMLIRKNAGKMTNLNLRSHWGLTERLQKQSCEKAGLPLRIQLVPQSGILLSPLHVGSHVCTSSVWGTLFHSNKQSEVGVMARFTGGYVKLYRKIKDSDICQNLNCYAVFSWLIMNANYKTSKIIWEGKQREIGPGQIVYGVREIADFWKISKSAVSRWINFLHQTGRVRNEPGSQGSFLTICDWADYYTEQPEDKNEVGHERDTVRTRVGHERDINEEVQEEKNIYTPTFEAFWAEYPRKNEKAVAFSSFKKLKKKDQELAITAAKNYAASCANNENEFIKLPATFLNKDRWRDCLEEQPSFTHDFEDSRA